MNSVVKCKVKQNELADFAPTTVDTKTGREVLNVLIQWAIENHPETPTLRHYLEFLDSVLSRTDSVIAENLPYLKVASKELESLRSK